MGEVRRRTSEDVRLYTIQVHNTDLSSVQEPAPVDAWKHPLRTIGPEVRNILNRAISLDGCTRTCSE